MLPWALEGIELGDHLLEVGPGPGLTTDVLRTRVTRMTVIEIDPRLANSLQRRLAGTNVNVIEGDATQMQFADGVFSAAVALTMLHHIPSVALQDKMLAEVQRVLRPGGVFAGIDSTISLRFRFIHIGDTMVVANPNTFGSRLVAAGFRDVHIVKAGSRFRFQARR
ncbi:MAG: class I SAM-dependent methyltransferase [Anaerolineales bacterium]